MAPVNEAGDGVDDAGNLTGGAGVFGGALDVEGVHGSEVIADELLNECVLRHAALLGALDYLVVNVGEVLDVADAVALVFQVAPQGVEDDVAEGVPDMGSRVGGYAADVHFDFVGVGGDEGLNLPAQGVVEFHGWLVWGVGSRVGGNDCQNQDFGDFQDWGSVGSLWVPAYAGTTVGGGNDGV